MTAGNLLVVGGPGSGKTTISILKAAQIADQELSFSQKVIFLSFARATVSRVWEALEENEGISKDIKKKIVVDTYHSFFWSIIRTHGYLLGLPRSLTILTPAAEAIALSSIRNNYESENKLTEAQLEEKRSKEKLEQNRLAFSEGKISFDLFASLSSAILHSSKKIRTLVSNAYPSIILDEFQDTSADQWSVVKALGQDSTVIALADPEQRIFDFIGADPERLNHFRSTFASTQYDLTNANYRSAGTEIALFGNDILSGRFRQKYQGIQIDTFESIKDVAYAKLKGHTLQARKRLIDSGKKDWSLAVLVPTKKMMRLVSDSFRSDQASMPAIRHQAAVDMEGVILASEIIAFLMQPNSSPLNEKTLIELLCNFFQGRGGDKPTKTDINTSASIQKAYDKVQKCREDGKSIPANSIMNKTLALYSVIKETLFSGDAGEDWLAIRTILEDGDCKKLNAVAEEAKNIRLLNRGTQLREALSLNWRETGTYSNALEIVRQSFLKEYFSTAIKPETGVIVMNMHKAKGKQFDEVIIFEGWPKIVRRKIVSNPDRILRANSKDQDLVHARQNFRVSVTRAKKRTTILTPVNDPCALLVEH